MSLTLLLLPVFMFVSGPYPRVDPLLRADEQLASVEIGYKWRTGIDLLDDVKRADRTMTTDANGDYSLSAGESAYSVYPEEQYDGRDLVLKSPSGHDAIFPKHIPPVGADPGAIVSLTQLHSGRSFLLGRGLSLLRRRSVSTTGGKTILTGVNAEGLTVIADLDKDHEYVARSIKVVADHRVCISIQLGEPKRCEGGPYIASSAGCTTYDATGHAKMAYICDINWAKSVNLTPDDFAISIAAGTNVVDNRGREAVSFKAPRDMTPDDVSGWTRWYIDQQTRTGSYTPTPITPNKL
jgi:hypothetical protein